MLPVVNVPLLEYVMESLAASGVQEIFVFCCSHAKMIQEYLRYLSFRFLLIQIRTSKWSKTPGLNVQPVISLTSMSAGEELSNEAYIN